MKIQFGTALTTHHIAGVTLSSCLVFAIGWFNGQLINRFSESQVSILRARGLNVTYKSPLFSCGLPYDDYLCSILLNKSYTSEKCITNVQLLVSRILLLISFIFQIFLIRELFSFSGDHRRVIIYTLWIVSIFIFVIMTIYIYWSSCFHAYINLILFLTGGSLCFLSMHNLLVNIDRMPSSSSNHNQAIITHRSEETDNENRA
jgi:hypothetical protein